MEKVVFLQPGCKSAYTHPSSDVNDNLPAVPSKYSGHLPSGAALRHTQHVVFNSESPSAWKQIHPYPSLQGQHHCSPSLLPLPKATHCSFPTFLIQVITHLHKTCIWYKAQGKAAWVDLQHLALEASFLWFHKLPKNIFLCERIDHVLKDSPFQELGTFRIIVPSLQHEFSFTSRLKETTYNNYCVLENVTKQAYCHSLKRIQPAFTNTSTNT